MPTILHVEDDPLWARVVQEALAEIAGASYIGPVSDGSAFPGLYARYLPDVVVIEPYVCNCDVTKILVPIKSAPALASVILLSSRITDAVLYHLCSPRVCSVVWKTRFSTMGLASTLESAVAGRRALDRQVRMAWDALRTDPHAFFKLLSNREFELLPIFATGDSNEEIADRLGIAPMTAKSHRESTMRKLGLSSSTKLMRWCAEKGFSSLDRKYVASTADEY